MITGGLDKTLSVGTDVAAWFLFHPHDLAHRRADPLNWWSYDFAIFKEFAAGTLVAVCTGGDGNSKVRFTNVGLTEREVTYAVSSADFRLQVKHQSLYLDGGYVLPAEECDEIEQCDPEGYGWIELPNGNYRVTVHAIAWYDEPGALDENNYSTESALAAYVVHFQSVADLDSITPPTTLPDLSPVCSTSEDVVFSEGEELSIEHTPLEWSEYPVLQWHEVIFPYIQHRLDLTGLVEPFGLSDKQMVMVLSLDVPTIGTLVKYRYGGTTYSEGHHESAMGVVAIRLVELKRVFKRNEIFWAEVEPYNPTFVPADLESIDELKRLFADYAAIKLTNSIHVEYPHFYAEHIASLTKARELGWRVAHALDLISDRQQELLALSERDLIHRLICHLSQTE
ncbi:DUF6386 family protein [Microcoleus vaginatus DQ-U2]|uniref:DUF6386 family protein n=1 Tax=Microcoleus vaginatus TaxID=119532 RepID=UPI00168534ED|nr:hypothetical protein [Microcoleus sp. FACHB-DQ6]